MDEEVGVLQGQSGCTNLNALNGILTKEHDSDGDKVDLTPKVRKPYTITKQRERWTAEEHNKFLEAVQLHGRAWRRIEEHVGTKTAVQIRSHAQKFVSKMDRDANDNGTGNMKPIEIPPPRPKKKPAHPYPRKQVLSSTKEIPILGMLERSSSSVLSVSEQDRSPTSVISVVGSEFIDPFSNIPIGFASPVGLAPVSNNHESEILSPKNSVEGVDKHLSLGLTPAGLTTEDEPTMELDMNSSMEHIHSKEASSGESVVPTLKLFGKTLVLTNYCKLFSSRAADVDQRSTQDMISESNCNAAMELDSEKLAEKVINGGFAMNGTWPGGGFLPVYYWWPPLNGNETNSTGEARVIPPPWLPCYANISFPYAYTQQQIRSREGLNRSNLQNECSGTGSNTDFEGANAAESEPDECRDEKEMGFCVVRKARKIDNGRAVKCSKGFVPYRRCDLEEKVTHPNIASDSVGDSQTLKLCL